jgi:uncharacterized protein (DUF1330 family)
MTVTVLAMITIAEGETMALSRYLEVTEPLLKRVNAKVINRFTINESVVGHRPAKTMVIVEYPNRTGVDLVFQSDDYKALLPTRDLAFSSYDISIADQIAV